MVQASVRFGLVHITQTTGIGVNREGSRFQVVHRVTCQKYTVRLLHISPLAQDLMDHLVKMFIHSTSIASRLTLALIAADVVILAMTSIVLTKV